MVESTNKRTENPEKPYFLDYIIVLAKNSRVILYPTFIIALLTFLTLFFLPKRYIATVRLLPPQQNLTLTANLLNSLGGGGAPGVHSGGTTGGMAATILGLALPADIYAGIMMGNTISDRIIERFKLRKLYKQKYIESARKELYKRRQIFVERKSGLLTVDFTDKDPQRAAEIANAFAEELDKLLQNLATNEAKNRLAFLENERLQTSQNLVMTENALRTFSEKNSVLQIDAQTKGVLEYIARLRAEIDAKEVQILVLRQQATTLNYDMVRLETEVNGLKNKLKTAETQHDQACIGDVCLTSTKIPSLGLEYLRLYREVKFQDSLYLLYTKLVELARLDMVKGFPVVQIVDQARPPERRSNKYFFPTLLAGGVTFFLMVLLTFGIESWHQNKNSVEIANRLALLNQYLGPWSKFVTKFLPKSKIN
jgi:tyrosine-protein kinase Etk/Wzc